MKPQLKLAECVGKTLLGILGGDYQEKLLLVFDDGFAVVGANDEGYLRADRALERNDFADGELFALGIYTAEEIAAFDAQRKAAEEARRQTVEAQRIARLQTDLRTLDAGTRDTLLAEFKT